ncbi:MAG TPA: hypothetical protein VK181_12550 [Rhizobium sp.]|nr:hypothetical protein [Rhizobium sp.]
MHEYATIFRQTMEDEMKNWRVFGYTPDHWRIDDWPRYRDQPLGTSMEDQSIHHYEFSSKDEASAYVVDLAVSRALHEIEKKQKAAIRKKNRRREKDRIARINKGNPHVL